MESLRNYIVNEVKAKPFVANQIFDWLYRKNEPDFDKMLNLSKSLRDHLREHFTFELPEVLSRQESADGKTVKLLLGGARKARFETVFMRDGDKATICISSQAGCDRSCIYCATGSGGFTRNLYSAEIIGQVLAFKKMYADSFPRSLRVVFMGMGEPFHNMNQVFRAIEVLTEEKGLAIGSRKITVSTSGCTKGIYRLNSLHPQVQLAITMPSIDDGVRFRMMGKIEPVEDVLKAAATFCDKTSRKITFEVIIFGGKYEQTTSEINDMAKRLKELHCSVNLIPFNPFPGCRKELERPSGKQIRYVESIYKRWNHEVTVRYSKGGDIQAACGQLSFQKKD
jgi:23S rRNA (adenine2503-C2)-methyltransferase